MMADTGDDTPNCPHCGSHDVIPVVYGLPDEELEELARRGSVWLGGCIVWAGQPEWKCRACHREITAREVGRKPESGLLPWE
jgi:hypothetical protein